MKKKLLTLLLGLALAVSACFGLVACSNNSANYNELVMPAYGESYIEIDDDFKLGVICLHDENSTYDKNFLEAVEKARVSLNLKKSQVIIKTGIPEGAECTTAANALVAQGCKAIFADSFGHESYLKASAVANPNVQYYHATGTTSKTAGVANFHNAFASIYEGRYLAGYAAGLKLNTMKDKAVNNNFKVGYVGAWPYAEVISGYTSWFLGVQAALEPGYTATMEVKYTNSWYDEVLEKASAEALIGNGCVLISQHADSWGAPNACERAGVPNVSYNGSTIANCPETFIISSKIDWTSYFKMIIAQVGGHGPAVATDFCGSIDADMMVVLTNANADVCAPNTISKLIEVRNQLVSGELKVFDCSKFTVVNAKNDTSPFSKASSITMDANGHLTAYIADVIDEGDYVPETNVIKTDPITSVTYFDESNAKDFRSAPYFDIVIDGITVIG